MAIRLVVLAAMFAGGCSFAAVSTPRERPAPPLQCKTSSVAPPADAVLGGLALILGVSGIIEDRTIDNEYKGIGTVVGLSLIGLGTLYGLSATYGFVQTARCRRFHRELGLPPAARR